MGFKIPYNLKFFFILVVWKDNGGEAGFYIRKDLILTF